MPIALFNTALPQSQPAPPAPVEALHPLLDRVLRRCPLLPLEVERIESRLRQMLDIPTCPGQVATLLLTQLEHRPDAQQARLRAQLLAALENDEAGASRWQAECARVLAALLDAMVRLQGPRAAGAALYLVTNRLFGGSGVQALAWLQQAGSAAALLARNAWLPWLEWLGQLPLPSLREGGWLEPLLAALLGELHTLGSGLADAHEALHARLAPSDSPVQLMLLATTWVLWSRLPPAAEPVTALGRDLVAVPQALQRLDAVGHGMRQLLAAPCPGRSGDTAATWLPLTAATLGTAAFARSRTAPAAMPAATALAMLSAAVPAGARVLRTDPGVADDRVAMIEALWGLRDTTPANASADLASGTLQPVPHGLHAQRVRDVQQVVGRLYEEDDFLDVLYAERTPPCTLQMDNGTLSGRRVLSQARVALHPQQMQHAYPPWSPRTSALLQQLQSAVTQAGGCHDNAGVPLHCALQFHLGITLNATRVPVPTLDALIGQLEQRLPDQPTVTAAEEAATLQRLRDDLGWARAQPIRGIAPVWRNWRPDPRSILGGNLALARRVLLRLSQQPAFVDLCERSGVLPHTLEFPQHGAVMARARHSEARLALFNAETPPDAIATLASALRGLSALLHAPVRANGILSVSEMLAYYGVPWPGLAHDNATFDACTADIDRQLQRLLRPAEVPAQRVPPPDAPTPAPDHQATADALWRLFDQTHMGSAILLHAVPLTVSAQTPLLGDWREAQQGLQRLFENPGVWLPMRQANARFRDLRVAADRVLVAAREGGTLLRLNASLSQQRGLVGRFGCIIRQDVPPVSAALTYLGVALPWEASACHPLPAIQRLQLLSLLQQLHDRHRQVASDTLHAQALGDLHQVTGRLRTLDAGGVASYRPALGTAAATDVYPALEAFMQLVAQAQVNRSLPGLDAALQASFDVNGTFWASYDDGARARINATEAWSGVDGPGALLDTLRAHAQRLGGVVHLQGQLEPVRLLATYGGCTAHESAGPTGLQHCAERILGELRLGMRAHLVHARDLLDAEELDIVRESTTQFLARQGSGHLTLLEYLGGPLVQQGRFAWSEPDRLNYALSEMTRTAPARALQAYLLDALGWYGGSASGATSSTVLGSLTVVALVADLGPPSNREQRIVLGYRLHKHANRGRTFADIRRDFAAYLGSLDRMTPDVHGMAVRLALQEQAPELLGSDTPSHLLFGSAIAATDYASGVHLADSIQRGVWSQMNFTTLLTLSAALANDPEVPPEVRQMAINARTLPTLDWQAFRQLDGDAPPDRNQSRKIATALAAFDARVRRINNAVGDLLAPLPYRMPMVEAELKRVFPRFPGVFAGLAWNATELRLCNDREWFGHSFPLFELYAAGELLRAPQHWYPCRHYVPDTPLSRAQGHAQHALRHNQTHAAMQRGFTRLGNVTQRFQRRFDDYFARARQGYGVLIEEALYLRPEAERAAIARGNVTVFTLRQPVPDLEAQQETAADRHPYLGRFGVVYRINVEGKPRHFQLFPLQSRILPLDIEDELPLGGTLERRKVRLRNGKWTTVQVRRGTWLNVDWEAYAQYQSPVPGRNASVIVEPLVSNASSVAAPPGTQRWPFHALVAPVQEDFFWLDPVAFLHEARSPTSFEAHLKDEPLWLKTVEFIVPFVANLRRIGSTDRDEFALAAFGLYLEGVLVGWPLASGVSRVLARPGAMLSRARIGDLAGTLGSTVLGTLNPLAGTISVTRLGVGIVQQGLGGGVQFMWSWLNRPRLYPGRCSWTLRAGMAVLRGTPLPEGSPLTLSLRTVHDVEHVLVVGGSANAAQRTPHLFDPATRMPYGPVLRAHPESSGAAGVLFKVGEGLRFKPSAGKGVLKPIKHGSRASQEDSDEVKQPGKPGSTGLRDL